MTNQTNQINEDDKTWLVYDGECPFCSEYVKLVKLREAIGPIELVNARDKLPIVEELINSGFDLDDGMALKYKGQVYHGAECINMLALMSTPNGLFNRVNGLIFRSPKLSKVLYPALRLGRNTVLRLLGRSKIHT